MIHPRTQATSREPLSSSGEPDAARRVCQAMMERLPASPDAEDAVDLRRLDGKIVLVKSSRDQRNPPSARRGTIEVRQHAPDTTPEVRLAIEFPQMFTVRAHHRTIVLDHADILRLLASEYNQTYEFTIDDELQ